MEIKPARLNRVELEFLVGIDIKAATEFMYNLQILTGGDIIATFNGVRITMVDDDLHKRLGRIK